MVPWKHRINGLKANWAHWLKENKVHVIMQVALEREQDLPEVPRLLDLAKSPEQLSIYRLLSSNSKMGFSIVAPPELDPAKTAALRKAFEATLRDPMFLAEAEKKGLPIAPLSGGEVQKLMEETIATPKEAVDL